MHAPIAAVIKPALHHGSGPNKNQFLEKLVFAIVGNTGVGAFN